MGGDVKLVSCLGTGLVAWLVRILFSKMSELFAGPWIIAYALSAEHVNKLLTTLPTLKKEWSVSFDFKASSLASGITQVLHMTAGGKGYGPGSKYGDRTPAIWISSQRGFYVSSAVEGEAQLWNIHRPREPTISWQMDQG